MINHNAKGDLIARLVSLGLGIPSFDAQSAGPAHERTFHVTVTVGGQVLAQSAGRSKKEAERLASEQALQKLAAQPSLPIERLSGAVGTGTAFNAAVDSEGAQWPIYAQVLAQAVEAAIEFAGDHATLQDVQQDAAQFYRGLLGKLGHQPEITQTQDRE